MKGEPSELAVVLAIEVQKRLGSALAALRDPVSPHEADAWLTHDQQALVIETFLYEFDGLAASFERHLYPMVAVHPDASPV